MKLFSIPPKHRANSDIMERVRIASATRSIRSLARFIGVSDTSVRRWLIGSDRPSAARVAQIRAWLDSGD